MNWPLVVGDRVLVWRNSLYPSKESDIDFKSYIDQLNDRPSLQSLLSFVIAWILLDLRKRCWPRNNLDLFTRPYFPLLFTRSGTRVFD